MLTETVSSIDDAPRKGLCCGGARAQVALNDQQFHFAAAQPGVLPMSSTPLPFQRNFTTLSSPGMPLE
jgi:hypothetical protein